MDSKVILKQVGGFFRLQKIFRNQTTTSLAIQEKSLQHIDNLSTLRVPECLVFVNFHTLILLPHFLKHYTNLIQSLALLLGVKLVKIVKAEFTNSLYIIDEQLEWIEWTKQRLFLP